MQGAQFGAGVGAEALRQQPADVVVGGQGLGGAARVAQRLQAQGLEGLVQRVGVAQSGEFGQRPLGVAESDRGGVPGAHGVEATGLPAGRLGGAVGEVGEGRALPQREGIVEDDGRLGGVAVTERADAVGGQPLETVQVDVVRDGCQPVAALGGVDRARPEGPAQPPDQRLQRARRVGGRVPGPHLLHQKPRGYAPAGPQRQYGQQGTQSRSADGDGNAVRAERLGGAEDAIAHGVILSGGIGGGHGVTTGWREPDTAGFARPRNRRPVARRFPGAAGPGTVGQFHTCVRPQGAP